MNGTVGHNSMSQCLEQMRQTIAKKSPNLGIKKEEYYLVGAFFSKTFI
jgi:prophage tail gpP-like protein